MPCYITRPLDRREVTSQHFKDLGIQNAAPTNVANARICAVTSVIRPSQLQIREALPHLVATHMLSASLKLTAPVKCTHMTPPEYLPLFPRPPLILSFSGKATEKDLDKLTALGFVPQSMNRYSFYRGPSTDDAVDVALGMNVLPDAFSPYGTVNLNGLLALGLINRILSSSMAILPNLDLLKLEDLFDGNETKQPEKPRTVKLVKGKEDVTSSGIFFPYFDGLLLPDKTQSPATFIHTFQRCLGSTKKELSAAVKLIQQGWPSLSTTASGLAISHLLLGIELAGKAAAAISPVYINKEYTGFIITGEHFMVMLGTEVYTPVPKETISEEINDLNRHEQALQELADLLSDIKPIGESKREHVDIESLFSPRAIHSHIANRKLEPEHIQQVQKLTPRLSFPEKYWNPLDHNDIAKAIKLICEEKEPEDSVPFFYRSSALFTKDSTLSVLAAFGPYAPSLSSADKLLNFSLMTTAPSKMYKFKDSHVTDIPVFKLPLQEAFEQWKSVLKDGNIHMKMTGVDKNKVPKIKGLGTMIAADDSQGKKIFQSLNVVRERIRPQKRKNQEPDEEDRKGSAERAAKRAKVTKEGNTDLAQFTGRGGDDADGMDSSDDGW